MIKKIVTLIFFVSLASCVPTKNLIYLQGKPVTSKEIKRINNIPYRLQVDDIITIDIKSVEDKLVAMFKKSDNNQNQNQNQNFANGGGLLFGYSVNLHGNIRIPILGEVNVLGYTTKEVRLKLEEELRKYFEYIEDLFITVRLSGIKYTVIGEVGSPGPQIIQQNRIDIIDAVTLSGDITAVGNRKNVEVIRQTLSGRKKYYIDLTQATAFDSEVFYIKPNDIINVYPLPQKALGVGTTGLQTLSTAVSILSLITSLIIISRNL